jgi:hypothetical protein
MGTQVVGESNSVEYSTPLENSTAIDKRIWLNKRCLCKCIKSQTTRLLDKGR